MASCSLVRTGNLGARGMQQNMWLRRRIADRYQSCVVVVSLAGTTTIRSLSTQRRLAGGERTSLLRHRVKFGTRQSRFRWGFLERPDEASVTLFLRPGSLSHSAPNGRDVPRCKGARAYPPTTRPPLRAPSSTPGSAAVPSLRCLLYLCASSTINNDNTTTACVTAMYTGMVRGKVNLSSNRHACATFALGERKNTCYLSTRSSRVFVYHPVCNPRAYTSRGRCLPRMRPRVWSSC